MKILVEDADGSIADTVQVALDEAGLTPEEMLSGLVEAVITYAGRTSDPNRALDETVERLNEVTL